MSCQTGGQNSSGNCIKDVVRRILDAQRQVGDSVSGFCITGCEQSIDDLLSPSRHNRPTRHTTIPFMLMCKHACRPFVGTGISNDNFDDSRHDHFKCVESPIFKVRGFVRGSNNCVKLELLLPVHRNRSEEVGGSDVDCGVESANRGGGHGGSNCNNCSDSACGHFNHRHVHNFRESGICITVDLDCFCGITCLDAITPVPYR